MSLANAKVVPVSNFKFCRARMSASDSARLVVVTYDNVQDPIVEHGERKSKQEKIERSSPTDMVVSFPDGMMIAEEHANDTLEKVVRKIGVSRVRQVVEAQGLVMCKVPVISNRRDAKYGRAQRDLGNGWLLMTHSNNKMKKAFLEKVSAALGLGLRIVLN